MSDTPKSRPTPVPVPAAPPTTALFRGRFGKGYRPDTHDKSKDPTTRAFFGAPVNIPAEFTLEGYVTTIWDQGQTSSCVGWAFAQGIQLRLSVAQTPISLPSPAAIYTFARAKSRTNPDTLLTDTGSVPGYAALGLGEWGCPPLTAWAFDPATINDEPKFEDLEIASAFKFNGLYRIGSTGAERLTEIRQAISNGYPVVFGTDVDQAFEDYAGGAKPITAPDPNNLLGGHMMHFLGYTADGRFRLRNQWSDSWGDYGLAWVDESFVTAPQLGDMYVINAHATGV